MVKLKVGGTVDDDVRRLGVARAVVGPDLPVAVDANQRWDVPEAIDWMARLAGFEPYWIEEPTSPDDVLGHAAVRAAVAPVRVATGEHVQNRVVFKQLLQAGAVDVVQIDACRVGGVNENVAILLLAAKFGVPVCPHAGGVGPVRDGAAPLGVRPRGGQRQLEGRFVEYVDHLHEHFLDPAVIAGGRYAVPVLPGYSTQMRAETLAEYAYPDGPVWRG